MIDLYPLNPRPEGGPSLESVQREVHFDEHVLCLVFRIGGIREVPAISHDLRLIPVHKLLEGPHVTLWRGHDVPDEFLIRHELILGGVWHGSHVHRAYLILDTAHRALVTWPSVSVTVRRNTGSPEAVNLSRKAGTYK